MACSSPDVLWSVKNNSKWLPGKAPGMSNQDKCGVDLFFLQTVNNKPHRLEAKYTYTHTFYHFNFAHKDVAQWVNGVGHPFDVFANQLMLKLLHA